MKLFIKYIVLISALISGLSSCRDKIDLDLSGGEKVLVVDGMITNIKQTHSVKLTYSQDYSNQRNADYTELKSSTVYLKENGIVVDTMDYVDSSQAFITNIETAIGNTYALDITLPNGDQFYSLDEILQEPVPIDSLWSKEETIFGVKSVKLMVKTKEPAGTKDFYRWKCEINGKSLDEGNDIRASDDRFVDGNDKIEFEIYDFDKEDFEKFQELRPDKRVFAKLHQMRISQNYENFLNILRTQLVAGGSIFSPPPAEIRGNIRKKANRVIRAQGYFSVASVNTKSTEMFFTE